MPNLFFHLFMSRGFDVLVDLMDQDYDQYAPVIHLCLDSVILIFNINLQVFLLVSLFLSFFLCPISKRTKNNSHTFQRVRCAICSALRDSWIESLRHKNPNDCKRWNSMRRSTFKRLPTSSCASPSRNLQLWKPVSLDAHSWMVSSLFLPFLLLSHFLISISTEIRNIIISLSPKGQVDFWPLPFCETLLKYLRVLKVITSASFWIV